MMETRACAHCAATFPQIAGGIRGSFRQKRERPERSRGARSRYASKNARDSALLLRTVRFELRNISPHVVAIMLPRQARECHLDAWQIGLRVGDVFVERLLIPGDARVLHHVGISVAGDRAS